MQINYREEKEEILPLERIQQFLKLESKDISVILAYSAGAGLSSLVIPVAIQSLVNAVAFGINFQPIIVLTILVTIVLSFSGILRILENAIVELIQQRLFVRFSEQATEKLSKVRYDYWDSKRGTDYVNYFLDVSIVQKSGVVLLTDGMAILLQSFIGLLVLIIYHPLFIAFDIIFLFTFFIIILKFLGRNGVSTSIRESKAKHRLTHWLEELARNKTTFRKEPARKFSNFRTESIAREYIGYRDEHFKILIKQAIGFTIIQILGSAFVLGLGGYLVMMEQISLGQLVAAEIIVAKILDNCVKMDKYVESYYDLSASIDKLGHITDLPQENSGIENFPNKGALSIDLRNINYNLNIAHGIDGLFLKLEPGSFTTIIGKDNDRSHILDILYKFRTPESGSVEVGRFNLSELNLESYRSRVFLIRSPEIFSGSIADNIRVGEEIPLEEIRTALSLAGLSDFVSELKEGTGLRLSSNGFPLNFQESIQLMFARAFAHRPSLLLLDEVLDLLDPDNRKIIWESLISRKSEMTLISTGRKYLKQDPFDRVFFLENGILNEDKKRHAHN